MERNYYTMEFCRQTYTDSDGYKREAALDEYKMFDDIINFIRIALKNDYILKIWDDGLTIAVEYNFADPEINETTLEWVGPGEYIEKQAAVGCCEACCVPSGEGGVDHGSEG